MDKIDLATIIQETISTFCRNRIGDKPPVFVKLSPAITQVPWENRALRHFVRGFLYESLLTSDPDAPIDVKLRKRFPLKDLNAFVRVQPSYWLQLRVSGRGLRVLEATVEELFAELGYRCEEWLGADDSPARLGIFSAIEGATSKMVFCLESSRSFVKSDLLLPICDDASPHRISRPEAGHTGRH
jgi:hypothetical protein